MKPRLAHRAGAVHPSPTLAVSRSAAQLRAQGVDVVDLGLGEPDFPTPEFIKRAGIAAIEANKTKYTEAAGIAPLREAIADKFRRRGADVEAENILVGAGGKQCLYNACQVLFDEGDEVAVFAPYWVSFPEMVRLAGARPRIIPLKRDHGYRPSLSDVVAHGGDNLRGVIINSPANPTGAVIESEELEKILRWARERGIFVLFDECYESFLYDGRRHASPAFLWKEHGEHTLISGAVSKTFSMTGWRLGWALGPLDVIRAMNSLQSHSTSNATSISQYAALAALSDDDEAQRSISGMLAEYARRRHVICRALADIPGVICKPPDGAFYAFADVSALYAGTGVSGSIDFSKRLLEEKAVVTVPGAAFGDDASIRLSFAASPEQIEKGIARLSEFARSRL